MSYLRRHLRHSEAVPARKNKLKVVTFDCQAAQGKEQFLRLHDLSKLIDAAHETACLPTHHLGGQPLAVAVVPCSDKCRDPPRPGSAGALVPGGLGRKGGYCRTRRISQSDHCS
jgi:hypothetical protein